MTTQLSPFAYTSRPHYRRDKCRPASSHKWKIGEICTALQMMVSLRTVPSSTRYQEHQ